MRWFSVIYNDTWVKLRWTVQYVGFVSGCLCGGMSNGCRLSYRWPGTLQSSVSLFLSQITQPPLIIGSQSHSYHGFPSKSFWHPWQVKSPQNGVLLFDWTEREVGVWLADWLLHADCDSSSLIAGWVGDVCVDMLMLKMFCTSRTVCVCVSLCLCTLPPFTKRFIPLGRRRSGWFLKLHRRPKVESSRVWFKIALFGCCVNVGTLILVRGD